MRRRRARGRENVAFWYGSVSRLRSLIVMFGEVIWRPEGSGERAVMADSALDVEVFVRSSQ